MKEKITECFYKRLQELKHNMKKERAAFVEAQKVAAQMANNINAISGAIQECEFAIKRIARICDGGDGKKPEVTAEISPDEIKKAIEDIDPDDISPLDNCK